MGPGQEQPCSAPSCPTAGMCPVFQFKEKKTKGKRKCKSLHVCIRMCVLVVELFSFSRSLPPTHTHTHTHTHSHLVVWELRDAWPCGLCWGAKDPEDAKELVNLRVTREKGACGDHLGKDAANRPHVNGARVLTGAKQHLWRTVPKCHNLSPS